MTNRYVQLMIQTLRTTYPDDHVRPLTDCKYHKDRWTNGQHP